ncbi:MAG: 6,7-dimethyl-8-ribityllumazine synthase [PS1 clade bacterium]|nr:6,7-dimethyl-8-ribityllumazine synthase [Rhodobiaceae bacterium]MBL6786535.1 6,7-dimethyl-8-ribityllumazine synthase [PS1 clade bacterium]CAI8389119.1 MAG: 6,7-dimethyl-8-ribityllumazine synthase 1 [Rhodobiaceae bacterium UBA7378]HCQ82210.1 6,7-dimethyl-8-ribityllumazine synthase [Rhodobiaceae bacterium]|tara:strand:- start:1822 stop:2250 length:429 start_codon:yes stop_codon:yes gene_type:complete
MSKKILIVEARFYEEMADALADGAVDVLEAAGCQHERVSVPGVLEVPVAINYAAQTGAYDGYVALGVVIRGETTHYDIVCGESARGLMDLGFKDGLAIGNGIQTVENEDQAWARCKKTEKDKGGGAAKAALALLGLRDQWRI